VPFVARKLKGDKEKFSMPKKKTRKALAKRFRITSKGKVLHSKAGKSHLQSGKSGNRKRSLRKKTTLSKGESAKIKKIMQ
jgi:large subunit ribosomal protein L35